MKDLVLPPLADGAMGTMLMAEGLAPGEPPETWNVDRARRATVAAIHRAYADAGAGVVLTNSFGGHPVRLRRQGLEGRAWELNHAAALLARDAVGSGVLVAGSMGPSGELLEPLGDLSVVHASDGYALQADALAAGGVDVLWIETIADLAEVRAAIDGARAAVPTLPIVATITFGTGGRTVMGLRPGDAARELAALGVAAAGANCGTGPEAMEAVVHAMQEAAPDLPLVAKPNAGTPRLVDGVAVYDVGPDEMAAAVLRLRDAGATTVGGCCGSTPAQLAAVARALAGTMS